MSKKSVKPSESVAKSPTARRAHTSQFKHLSAEDRKAIYEILKETLPELPADW